MNALSGTGSGDLELLRRIEELSKENEEIKTNCIEQSKFSFEETQIGTWFNGKPLYRKMVAFGTLSESGMKTINHGIENIASPHINTGESYFCEKNQGGVFYSTYAFTYENYIVRAAITNTSLSIETNAAGANGYEAFVCVEYTKTTD